MKMHSKKGFTITELAIVIAVIAILAAVLIPTFSGIGQKAKKTAAEADATAIRNEMLVYYEGELPEDSYVIQVDGFWYTLTADGLSAQTKGEHDDLYDTEAAANLGEDADADVWVKLNLSDSTVTPPVAQPSWANSVYYAFTTTE